MKKQINALNILFILLIGATATLIFMADNNITNSVFQYIRSTKYGDKVVHFFLFGLIALGANFVTQLRQIAFLGIKLYLGTCVVAACVLTEEISQIYIPSRTFDWYDLLSDAFGISLFTLISYLLALRQNSTRNTKQAQ